VKIVDLEQYCFKKISMNVTTIIIRLPVSFVLRPNFLQVVILDSHLCHLLFGLTFR